MVIFLLLTAPFLPAFLAIFSLQKIRHSKLTFLSCHLHVQNSTFISGNIFTSKRQEIRHHSKLTFSLSKTASFRYKFATVDSPLLSKTATFRSKFATHSFSPKQPLCHSKLTFSLQNSHFSLQICHSKLTFSLQNSLFSLATNLPQ